MKVKGMIFFGFLFIAVSLNAQTDFRPGCVILTNGDSLFGEIDYRGDILMGQFCRFRNAITDKTVENEKQYFPGDIAGYRFDNGKFFQSGEINGKKFFLEFLVKGKLCIYYHRDENGNHYYLEKDSSGIIEIPYETGIKYKENIPYTYNSNKHIGVLNAYMHDAPDLQSGITNIGEPGHKNLIRLAENYNNEICKDEPCIIYEKDVPFAKISFEIVSGINFINTKIFEAFRNEYNRQYNDKPYFQYGVITHLWMPRTSENFYFRSGILFMNIDANYTKDSVLYIDNDWNVHSITIIGEETHVPIFKIPIQIEYIYPKGIFKPKVAYGINIYSPLAFDLSLICGLNIKLHKSVFFNVNYDYEYYGIIIPKVTMSHSILFGFQIDL